MTRYSEKTALLTGWFGSIVALAVLGALVACYTALRDNPRETMSMVWILVVFVLLYLSFDHMKVVVDENHIQISFGMLKWVRKKIPLADVLESKAIDYKPIRQCGGWGIRGGRIDGEWVRCYTASGNRGLLLTMKTEIRTFNLSIRKILIGSSTPELMKNAIESS